MDEDKIDALEEISNETNLKKRWMILLSKDTYAFISAIIGLLLGLISVAATSEMPRLLKPVLHWFLPEAKGAVFAQTGAPLMSPKEYLVMWMFVSLSVLFFWCIWAISRSHSAPTIGLARDMIKTLSGFFIGTITGFIGK